MSISDVLSPETLEKLTEATQKVLADLSKLAAACVEMCKSYEEAFRESVVVYYDELKLFAENTCASFAEELAKLADEAFDYYDRNTTPKQYGIALIKRRERFCKSPTYLYFQKPKKHLPYQRRCF